MDLNNPHDSFFTAYFGEPKTLAQLLRFTLPEKVFSLLDADSLVVEKNTYVEKNLRKQFSDITASITLQGKPAKIYILVEHKSYNDTKALVQILRYMTQIWAREAKETHSAPLTPILPILFYHGESSNTASQFSELFPVDFPEELTRYHPDFSVNLLNLTALPDAKLTGPPEVTAALWSLKYARSEIEKALAALERLAATVGDILIKNPGFDFLKVYLIAASNRTPEEIIDMINSIIHVSFLKENIMSTAEMLIEKGKHEGKQEERLILAKKFKEIGVSIEKIMKATGLSREEIEAL